MPSPPPDFFFSTKPNEDIPSPPVFRSSNENIKARGVSKSRKIKETESSQEKAPPQFQRIWRLLLLVPVAAIIVWFSIPHLQIEVFPVATPTITTAFPIIEGSHPRILTHATFSSFPIPKSTLSQQNWAAIPGALPGYFRYVYNDAWQGWPIKAKPEVVSNFLAPRGSGGTYHFGIDISTPSEKGAERVYAIESGVITTSRIKTATNKNCQSQHFRIGHFEYWKVSPTVAAGTYVRAGKMIGWSCPSKSIHISEWQTFNGQLLWVNPLHHGGKLSTYKETTPKIKHFSFFGPTTNKWCPGTKDSSPSLDPTNLSGAVELRTQIVESNKKINLVPYRIAFALYNLQGHLLLARDSFRADNLPHVPYSIMYAPSSTQDVFVYRPFSRQGQDYLNTQAFENGLYRIVVYTWNIEGGVSSLGQIVRINNRVSSTSAPLIISSRVRACIKIKSPNLKSA